MLLKKEYYYNEHDENQVKKLYKKKKRKKIKRKFKIACCLLVLVLILGYFFSGLSKVKNIKIVGNKDVSNELIETTSEITKQTTYLFINTKGVENKIKKLPLIKKANVSYDLLGNVTIEIEESKKVAYCIINKKTYVIDELGAVVEATDKSVIETLKSCPRLSKFKTLKFLKTFAKEYAGVPELIKSQTSDIIYSPLKSDETRIKFVLDNGKVLIVRVEDMADELTRFPYEAYMIEKKNTCEFNFVGDKIYMKDCKKDD